MSFSLFGDRRTTLPADWSKETLVGVFGDTRVDASAGAAPGARMTLVSVFGDTTVRVAPGSRVRAGGFTLAGDRRVDVSEGDGPAIAVKVYGLFGDVTVTDRLD